MAAKELFQSIISQPLEEVMGERFGRYSKYIIQERALPDARDGLKPVQRRVLYAMNKEGNTPSKAYRKSAKTVGNVIGNYHPHGDTSVYDAMVRMSQSWKLRMPLIDMHGNNGSIDNDPAAAMRYTEARMSKISAMLLEDLDKDTVNWTWNFDDTEQEPSVLPAKYPNLLINGAKGIASGYATDIPPHNPNEIIDATIARIKSPNCRLDTIMQIVKGPDFPTGGIAMGIEGVKDAFTTGKGRIILRSKVILPTKKNDWTIRITEVPYDVVKSNLVREIDELRAKGEISGIAEVRDESDRNGLTIAIDLKVGADPKLITKYLYKNTQLQVYYNYNMVGIINKRPMQMGILPLLDSYIEHQQIVVKRMSKYELEKSKTRSHILEGLVKSVDVIDQIIEIIKKSKGKAESKVNLIKEFNFTEEQAEAIVTLRLYRLSSTDVTTLTDELNILTDRIKVLTKLIASDELINKEVIAKLKDVKKNFNSPRLTVIEDEIEEIKIDKEDLIDAEDVYISISKDGYIKRSSNRSYQAATSSVPASKEGDHVVSIAKANTLDKLIVITSEGNYAFIPVYLIQDKPWKHQGEHMSTIVKVSGQDKVVTSIVASNFDSNETVVIATKNGLIKRTNISDFEVTRFSKSLVCMKVKAGDQVIGARLANDNNKILLTSQIGFTVKYPVTDISITGIKTSGVKGMTIRDDEVMSLLVCNEDDQVLITTDKGQAKRVKVSNITDASRTNKGNRINKWIKTNPQLIINTHIVEPSSTINVKMGNAFKKFKAVDVPLADMETGNSTTFGKNDNFDYSITNEYSVTAGSKQVKKAEEVKEKKMVEKQPVKIKDTKNAKQVSLDLEDFDI